MKIMILANSDTGLYKFRRELLEELVRNHQVTICLPDGEYIQSMVDMGCRFVPCDYLERRGKNPFKEQKLLSFYKKSIANEKPDIVFTYTIKPNIYGGLACQSLHIPYVVNVTGLGSAVENAGIMQKITLFLYKLGLKKAQKVFFQNTENRDFMLDKKVVSGPYDLLPGSGVNLTQYKQYPYPKQETIDFVFVARIMRENGIDQYLDAAEYIRKKYPETRFHVCGACKEEYREKLQRMHEEGTIVYHDKVKNMVEIYRMISCTIHPTYYPEGLSNVLLESSATGRPIITTDRAGCREVIEDGVNGFVCKQKDSQDLIRQVEKFLALSWEERKEMGLAGRRKVEKEFDRNIVIEQYLKEIDQVFQRK